MFTHEAGPFSRRIAEDISGSFEHRLAPYKENVVPGPPCQPCLLSALPPLAVSRSCITASPFASSSFPSLSLFRSRRRRRRQASIRNLRHFWLSDFSFDLSLTSIAKPHFLTFKHFLRYALMGNGRRRSPGRNAANGSKTELQKSSHPLHFPPPPHFTPADGDGDRDELRFEACDDFWVFDFSLPKPATYLHGLLRVSGQTVAPASISL